MLQDVLFQLLLVVVQAAIVVVGGYVIKFLKAKTGAEDLDKYYNMVKNIVMAVEQTFGPGNGPDKKAEALQLIKKITGSKLTNDQINTLIESSVYEINRLTKNNKLSQL